MNTDANLLKETFREWGEDRASRLAAALAYYTIFSIAPLLIVLIGVAGLVFGRAAVQGQLVGQVQGLVGNEAATLIQTMIANASRPSSGILATVIGLVTLLLGASGLFAALQDSLNTIWGVTPAPGRKIWDVLLARLLTFGMVLLIGLLLMASLVVSAALSALSGALASMAPVAVPVALWQVIDFAISLGVITLLFALIYKVLPDVRIGWRYVWIGAAFTSLLFTIGKFLIGFYMGHSGAGSTYGAAGSLVVLLLWIYYSSLILFFGAEFTKVYAHAHGVEPEPVLGTIRLPMEARLRQGMSRSAAAAAAASSTPVRPVKPAPPRIGPGAVLGKTVPPPTRHRPDHARTRQARTGSVPSLTAANTGSQREARATKTMAAAAAGAVVFVVAAVTRLGRRP